MFVLRQKDIENFLENGGEIERDSGGWFCCIETQNIVSGNLDVDLYIRVLRKWMEVFAGG